MSRSGPSVHRRVLVPLHAPRWGGVHGLQEILGPPLAQRGWSLLVALPSEDRESQERLAGAGVEVLPLPLARFRRSINPMLQIRSIAGAIRDVGQLRQVIRERNVAIAQICGLHNVQGAVAAKRTGVPLVWQLLSALVPYPIRSAMMPVVRSAADVVMTNGSGDAVLKVFPGLDRLGNRWLPFASPVDTSKFCPDPETRSRVRAQLGFAPDTIVVGTVGNRTFQKGHDIFVEAAAIARSRDARLRFCIIGTAVESNAAYYQKEVVDRAGRLGLVDRPDLVIVDGGRDIAQLITAFDVFTLTSRTEGIPLALIEAMATGLPTVVPDVGGMAGSARHHQTGLVLERPAPVDYAAAWITLAADLALRRRYGDAGRALTMSTYSVDAVADSHVAAYELAMSRHGARTEAGDRA